MSNQLKRIAMVKRVGAALVVIGMAVSVAGHADTIVAAWGKNLNNTTYGPMSLANVKAIAATYYTNLAVTSNGVVVAWAQTYPTGQNFYYPGISNAVAVAGGANYNLALNADGTVSAWGTAPYVPPGLANVTAIAAGLNHYLVLKSDGTVVAWGDNTFGQAQVPSGLANVVAIAAGDYHSLALRRDGTVAAWGSNASGQTKVPATLANVIAIAGGAAHTVVADASGRVMAWGNNASGQTNVPAGLSNVVAVAAGTSHSVALKADGTVLAWGDNSSGQTNVCAGLSHVVAISARALGNLALVSGTNVPPFISYQPVGGIVPPGTSFYFLCLAQGSPPLSYQWRHNGTNVAGTGTVLSLNPAQPSQSGAYSVLVSNAFGTQVTRDAIVAVTSNSNLSLSFQPVSGLGGISGSKAGFQVVACDSNGNCFLPVQALSLQLKASTNLRDWTTLSGALTLTNGSLVLQDPDAAELTRRFYRVFQP